MESKRENGRRGWRRLLLLAPLLLAGLLSPALAQDCKEAPVENCPSLYLQRCRSDAAFRDANSAECLRRQRIPTAASDPPACRQSAACVKSEAQKACLETAKREGIVTSIDEFFKACGLVNCPDNLEDIKSEFESITRRVNDELKNYGDLLNLDPANIDSRQALCKYTREQMSSFKKQANSDRGKLIEPTRRLAILRTCSEYIVVFVENAKRDWAGGLRDSLIRDARRDSEEARQEGSKAETQIQKLESAPKKVEELSEIHNLGCKRSSTSHL